MTADLLLRARGDSQQEAIDAMSADRRRRSRLISFEGSWSHYCVLIATSWILSDSPATATS